MLALPTVGISRSVEKHNVNLNTLCDWMEGSILFDDEELSKSDVIDVLIEDNFYATQSFAWELIDNAWRELERRQSCIGKGYPLEFVGQKLKRSHSWRDVPAHSFCVALAFAEWYPKWAKGFGSDYTEQGAFFEKLTNESLMRHFPDWEIHPVGWMPSHPSILSDIVKDVILRLGEEEGEIELWINDRANDAGLDLLCYRPFEDNRVGIPVFLMQCASGKDWKDKLRTPSLEFWTNVISFASKPKKAFAMPYVLPDREFRQSCIRVDGMFLDRCRLLSPGRTTVSWVSTELKKDIVAWLKPRIEKLPRADK